MEELDNNINTKNNRDSFVLLEDANSKNLKSGNSLFLFSDNEFCYFNSINDILYLVYANKNNSIIFYNIIDLKKINEIKNAHNGNIINFRHCLDKIKYRDLLMTISVKENNLKVWDANIIECIFNIKRNILNDFILGCFLIENDHINIIIKNHSSKLISIYDLNGNKINKIDFPCEYSNDSTFYIDTYYDSKLSKNYIITGNREDMISFDYNELKLYKYYLEEIDVTSDKKKFKFYNSLIIYEDKEIVKLIGACLSGFITIWNFHSRQLIKYIFIADEALYSLLLWNKQFLFVGYSGNENLKLIDLKTNTIIKSYKAHKKGTFTIKKINYPIYGECVISMGDDFQIKIWKNMINLEDIK